SVSEPWFTTKSTAAPAATATPPPSATQPPRRAPRTRVAYASRVSGVGTRGTRAPAPAPAGTVTVGPGPSKPARPPRPPGRAAGGGPRPGPVIQAFDPGSLTASASVPNAAPGAAGSSSQSNCSSPLAPSPRVISCRRGK